MVAGGVALAVPYGRLVAEAWQASTTSQGPAVGGVIDTAAMPPPGASPALAAAAPREWLVPDESLPPPITPRPDYTPPSPPDQLPPVSRAAAADASGFNATYRSTLEVPPPPLLDAHAAPPPVVAWMDPRSPAPAAVSPPLAAQGVPATYRVRDGDDLTGIATRFYGHAGAAGSLWSANRDVLPDPNLLPIGAELRLPPPWAIQGVPTVSAAGVRAIEPPPTAASPRAVPALPVAAAAWLDGQQAANPSSTPAARGTVRLAPGETLETLAERFYGDRRAAPRIWEANRDRLRSPDLVAPGMELRLP